MAKVAKADLQLEEKIVDHLTQNPKGLSQTVLNQRLNSDPLNFASALNGLLKKGRIEALHQGKQKTLIFKLKDTTAPKIKGEIEKKVVYDAIKNANTQGIWSGDIAKKINLSKVHVAKILKQLEAETLIKSVDSVGGGRKKKVYLLYDLEPDAAITGGVWYDGSDFDVELVDILNQQCHKYLQEKLTRAKAQDENPIFQRQSASATTDEIIDYISKLGLLKVSLSINQIEDILDSLIYDGKIEKAVKIGSSKQGSINTYVCVQSLVQNVGFMQVPCGVCPVIDKCSINGEISPSTCPYMKQWLQLEY